MNRMSHLHGLFLCFWIMVSSLQAYSFFDYDMYPVGAKANGLGGAYTAIADDSSAVFWNPAGIIQQKNTVISYLLDSQFMLNDIRDPFNSVFKVTYETPALISFLTPLFDNRIVAGLSAMTPIQRKIDGHFYIAQFSPVVSFLSLPNLSIGIAGGVLLSELRDFGWGWDFQAGLLWFVDSKIRAGLNFRSSPVVSWTQDDIQGVFPWSMQAGISYKVSWDLILSMDIEYIGWRNSSLLDRGIERAPVFDTGLFYEILPKIGLMYTHEQSGAHLRLGLNTSSFLDASVLVPQYKLAFGIGGKAFKIVEIEASLVDSYLISLFYEEQRVIETIQVNIEYKFE